MKFPFYENYLHRFVTLLEQNECKQVTWNPLVKYD